VLFKNEAEARKFEKTQEDLRRRFEGSTFLSSKGERERNHLLRGDKVMFVIRRDVLASMAVDPLEFRAWYEVLSSHLHSYPLAFHRTLLDGRGDGVENNIDKAWIAMTVDYVRGFLARALTQMLSLFPDIADPRLPGAVPLPRLAVRA
jgi:hypothetical protein